MRVFGRRLLVGTVVAMAACGLGTVHAAAATLPPGVVSLGPGEATLSWTPLPASSGVAFYSVRLGLADGPIQTVGTTTQTSYVLTGLLPDSATIGETLKGYMADVVAEDANGVDIKTVLSTDPNTPPGNGDTTAPTAPTGLATTPGSNQLGLVWNASTDDVGVAGYAVYLGQGSNTPTLAAATTGTSLTLTGLSAGTTYTVAVAAYDAAGHLSGRTAITTTTGGTTPPPTSCQVTYTTASQWQGGFQANVTITNTGSAAWTGWMLAFEFPDAQQVTNAWNAQVTQSGYSTTASNVSWNGAVPAHGTVSFGFQGTWNAAAGDNPPTAFAVNGAACQA